MTKSLHVAEAVITAAFGMTPTAAAELSRAMTGYEAIEEAAALLIPDRNDLMRQPLPTAAYALARAEVVTRLVEASNPAWPETVPLLIEAGRLADREVRYERFDPLNKGGVLDEFLALKSATRGGSRGMAIQRFADRFGFLGLPLIVVVRERQVHAELLPEWSNEVERLHRLDELWRLLGQSRGDHHISWGAREAALRIRKMFDDRPLAECQQLAQQRIVDAVNDRLAGEVQVGVSRRGRLTWMPRNLLAVIYLQFAGRVLGAVPGTRPCKVCGTPIPPDRSHKRQFCSDKCRSKHHRQKRGGTTNE